MKRLLLIIILIFLVLFLGSDIVFAKKKATKANIDNYQTFYKELAALFRSKDYNNAKLLLEKNVNRFPEKLDRFAYNMAIIYQLTKDYDKGIAILKKALGQGLWFNIYLFKGDLFKEYKKLPEFAEVIALNDQLQAEAQKQARPLQKVVLPEDYKKNKKYPLFIALHGGGDNIKTFEPQWHSDKLRSEFIVLYIQSSQMISRTGYSWENQELTKKEILEAFNNIKKNYLIDTGQVFIGGFSSGGFASLITVMDNTIPLKGFVVLCPPVPENVTVKNISAARDRGIKGTLLTTEMDPRLEKQKQLSELFKKGGLEHRFIVTPNIGHWYPKDLDKKIDQAIDHIKYK